MCLSDADIDQLETLLFADHISEDALDYFGLHGLVCASVVGPKPIPLDQIIATVFSDAQTALDEEARSHITKCVETIAHALSEDLTQGNDIALPHEEEEQFEACLESWCIGFMEGFFLHEESWFIKGEEVAAELLLPIMALSGLFESEEFDQIHNNDKLMSQFESLVADQLTDIYLFYHSE